MQSQSQAKIRVGAVNYLNTRPLVYGLDKASDRIELSFDLPTSLRPARSMSP
jgi:chorismate dehydratase